MNWVTLAAGTIVVLAVLVDVIWTSMWVGGPTGSFVRTTEIDCGPRRHCDGVDIRKRLGSTVRRLRLEKGWSQED